MTSAALEESSAAALAAPDREQQGATSTLRGASDENTPALDSELGFQLRHVLRGHTKTVSSVKFGAASGLGEATAGGHLASASADQTIRLWQVSNGSQVAALKGHNQGISDVAWNKAGTYVCSASDDMTLKLWDVERGSCVRTLGGHSNYVFCCNFAPQGNILASGSFDETLRLWDVRSGRCIREVPAHSDPVTSLDFSYDGTLVATSSLDGLLRVWDVLSGKCLRTLCERASPPVSSVRFTPNGKYLLCSSLDSKLRLWDYEKRFVVRAFSGGHVNKQFCSMPSICTTAPGPHLVVMGSEGGGICMYNIDSTKVHQTIPAAPDIKSGGPGHCDHILATDCHTQLPLIASGSYQKDTTIRLWAHSSYQEQSSEEAGTDVQMQDQGM